jgi:hypothetical protein
MRVNINPLIKFCGTRTDPAAETKSIGLADGALFFARHLDCFILTQNSHPSPGLGTVKTIYRDQTTPVHLPGLAKKLGTAIRQLAERQLIKPPSHYI